MYVQWPLREMQQIFFLKEKQYTKLLDYPFHFFCDSSSSIKVQSKEQNIPKQIEAFLFEGKQYQFRHVPFGLKTAGCVLIRAMNHALPDEIKQFVTIYVEHLDNFFQMLINTGFTIRLSKSVNK